MCLERYLYIFLMIVAAALTVVQGPDGLARSAGNTRVEMVEGRRLLILPASEMPRTQSSDGIAAQSFESASHRTHVVYLEGETYSAATPLQGPGVWIAFDLEQYRFESLLPSIRVELDAGERLDAAVGAVGATGVEVFDSLGFAILNLPSDLHPADAVALVRGLSGQPDASLRLRRPRIEWR